MKDNIFAFAGLPMGRMISASKSGYRRNNPDNDVIFNANIFTKSDGKIWYGDLDITESCRTLQLVAEEIEEPLYILYESDGRFDNEDIPFEQFSQKAAFIVYDDRITKKER